MKKKNLPNNPCYYSPKTEIVSTYRRFEDSEYFASRIELDVFRRLQTISCIKVHRQYPLTIKDATNTYPRKQWRCDYRIESIQIPSLFLNIEAKGTLYLPEFKSTLQYLEFFAPSEYRRLLIVSRESFRLDTHNVTVTPNEMMLILQQQGFC